MWDRGGVREGMPSVHTQHIRALKMNKSIAKLHGCICSFPRLQTLSLKLCSLKGVLMLNIILMGRRPADQICAEASYGNPQLLWYATLSMLVWSVRRQGTSVSDTPERISGPGVRLGAWNNLRMYQSRCYLFQRYREWYYFTWCWFLMMSAVLSCTPHHEIDEQVPQKQPHSIPRVSSPTLSIKIATKGGVTHFWVNPSS